MSTLNAALTYKLQKMKRTLSSLMEENHALRTVINEYNSQATNPTQVYNYAASQGGNPGQALGAYLAGAGIQQPSVGGMGKVAGGMSPTSTSTGGGLMAGGVGSFGGGNNTAAARSLTTQPAPVPGSAGQGLGAFLAAYGINVNDPNAQVPVSVLNTLFSSPSLTAGGMQTAQGSATQATQRRR